MVVNGEIRLIVLNVFSAFFLLNHLPVQVSGGHVTDDVAAHVGAEAVA
jgi:hypothetical protein